VKAARLAEAATLGSLLIDPTNFEQITAWLRAGDFADPWHGQLYTVMRERQVAGQAINAEDVGLHLLDKVGPNGADLVRVVGLLWVAPVRPQPLRYAAMVLECSLRREVAGQGVLLRASALSTALTQGRRPVVVGTALVDDALAAGEGRWQLASGESLMVSATHPELAPALRNLDRFLAADKFLTAHPDLDLQQVRDHERRLVAAMVSHPAEVEGVSRWLSPDALVDRPWRAVYAALLEFVDRGKPVDAVTVAWQVQHSSRQLGPGPDPGDLIRAVDAAAVDDPRYYSRPVAADIVRRTADSAARTLQAAADNPGIDVPDLFETARLVTASVRSAACGFPESVDDVPARHLVAVRDEPMPDRWDELSGPVAG
jgi:replicative DNA helicase